MKALIERSLPRKWCLYACSVLIAVSAWSGIAAPKTEALSASELLTKLYDLDGSVLVAAHKGDWRNHPENSLSGIQSAIDMGVEMVEIDIRKTADGKLVLMHDDNVDRTTDGTGNVSSLTLSQIKALKLREGQGGSGAALTNETVPTLEEAMNLAKGKVLVNLDKCWDIRNDVWSVLVSTGTTSQGVFKSTASNATVDAWLDSKSPRPLYQAVITDSDNNLSELDALIAGAQPDLYELVFVTESSSVISSTTVNKITNAGRRVFVNTLWASLNAGHTDDMSVDDPDSGWGWVVNRGASFIQTDRPSQLVAYLNSREPLEAGWASKDIGTVGSIGSAGSRNGQFTLTASGFDIWTAADQFRYAYQPVSGDIVITARVKSQDHTSEWAKAGIMIRESLNADSKFADVVVTPSHGINFQRRPSTGLNLSNTTGYTDSLSGGTGQYVRLVRSGNTFTGFASTDGSSWTQIGSSVTISMSSSVYVGLAVTAHDNSKLGSATFDQVTVAAANAYSFTTVALRQGVSGYTGTTDAHVLEYYADRNTGGNGELETASYSGADTDEKHALIRFTLPSSIPSNAIITSAQLRVRLTTTRNGTVKKAIAVKEATGSWAEGAGTGIDGQTVSGVTWNTKPGYGASTIDQATINSARNAWYTFNVTDLVQSWVNGTSTNYGFVLLENTVNSSPGTKDFASANNNVTENRPSLVVTYRLP
ncbi:DNRLRE domain-containing protein [Cohnella fermenti]|uniref:DNRLRE domain-containing protein n=1 Tax=Cohnella fermenti TaxID=2565925 RepID=UPI001454DF84|nr:DNRLRE domain-containing protein [Cohnella fermenti]